MGSDYVPDPRDQRYRWYQNISNNVTGEVVKFGGTPAQATAIKAIVDGIMAGMDDTDAKQKAADTARGLEHATEDAGLQQLRAQVKNWKTLPGWAASGSETTLQLSGAGSAFDASTFKTPVKLKRSPEGVLVSFVKKGVRNVNVYMRVRPATAWIKLATESESPYLDSTPLAQPGVPEVREYLLRGVLHDHEVGLDSDVVNITVAG